MSDDDDDPDNVLPFPTIVRINELAKSFDFTFRSFTLVNRRSCRVGGRDGQAEAGCVAEWR